MRADRLIVFCRYPEPGRVKTRLIPVLGRVGAAGLHRMMVERTLSTASSFAHRWGITVEVSFEGGDGPRFRRWLGSGVRFSAQSAGNLGEKMSNAFYELFARGTRKAILIGTDIPRLEISHLKSAFQALESSDLVLGPSKDGGYYLMGLKAPADLFQGISWGSKNVLEKTVSLAEKSGMKIHKLEPLVDIDTIDDLRGWMPGLNNRRTYISVIIPALNEDLNIASAIESALDDESEVIVVDGGSRDQTVETALRAGVRTVVSAPGRALQQNTGAGLARGDVLLFLHADTKLPERYIDYVFDFLMDQTLAAGAFMFKTDISRPGMKIVETIANMRARYLDLPYGDQGLFMKKSVFTSVGGFSDVPIAEDLMLIRKLSKLGSVRILPVPIITSGRRWKNRGVIVTTLINQLVLAGMYLGISPTVLRLLYGGREKTKGTKSCERNNQKKS